MELPDLDLQWDLDINRWDEMFHRLNERPRRRLRRIVVDKMNPFQAMTEEEFVERFRLKKDTVRIMINDLQNHLVATVDQRGSPVPPHLQVLIALGCMSTGTNQNIMGDCYSVSQSTVSRCLSRVARGVAGLRPQYVKFPEVQELQIIMQDFYMISGMPGVVGCIDCTNIAILKPTCNNAEYFRCSKGYFSYNVQAICGPNLKFYNVVARWPGSVHDSKVFRNSQICQAFVVGEYPGHLLGDSGYPCTKYLLTPLQHPQDEHEEKYNSSHIKTRNTIERAFGVLKKRFAYLGKVMRTDLETTKAIIVASFVLHNLAVTTRIIDPAQICNVNDGEQDVGAVAYNEIDNIEGQAKRREIIRNYF